MAVANVPVFKINYETDDPITTLISEIISQNLQLLEDVPHVQKQLNEIEEKNDFENKEIDTLISTSVDCENEIKNLEQSIERSKKSLLKLIKKKRLTKEDFMARKTSLLQYASFTYDECLKLESCIGNNETSDV